MLVGLLIFLGVIMKMLLSELDNNLLAIDLVAGHYNQSEAFHAAMLGVIYAETEIAGQDNTQLLDKTLFILSAVDP